MIRPDPDKHCSVCGWGVSFWESLGDWDTDGDRWDHVPRELDEDHEPVIADGAPRPFGALTLEDRTWAIDHVLRADWERARIASAWAGGRDQAIRATRSLLANRGSCADGFWVECFRSSAPGMHVRRGTRQGIVRWGELADTCNPGPRQTSLFDVAG